MSSAFRTIALTTGILFIAACSNDKQAAEDVLAEDSTLALEVMSARPDSVLVDTAELAPANTTPPNTTPPNIAASTSVAANVEPAPIAQPSSPIRTRSVRRAAPPKPTARLVIAPQKKRISRVRASRAPTSIVEASRRAESTPLKSSALIPAGTQFSLTADQRICASMSRVGDTFATRTTADVVGPIGVVIPKGTPALAQISSVNKNDLDVDLMSIDVQGRSYTFASDVTHTDVERVRRKSSVSKSKVAAGAGIGAVAGGVIGGNPATTVLGAAAGGLAGAVATRRPAMRDECVPEGGRIDVKLTEPLRVSLSD